MVFCSSCLIFIFFKNGVKILLIYIIEALAHPDSFTYSFQSWVFKGEWKWFKNRTKNWFQSLEGTEPGKQGTNFIIILWSTTPSALLHWLTPWPQVRMVPLPLILVKLCKNLFSFVFWKESLLQRSFNRKIIKQTSNHKDG